MSKQIVFAIGGFGERNIVEIVIDGENISCEITSSPDEMHNLPPLPNSNFRAKSSRELVKELDALNIFSWQEYYDNPNVLDGTQWSLRFKDGDKLHKSGGSNAYPENWVWFVDWINAVCLEKCAVLFEPQTSLKFTIGTVQRGYKSVEILIGDSFAQVGYKILRNEFKPVDKNQSVANVDNDWLYELYEINIPLWEKFYGDGSNGVQWSLTLRDSENICRSRGTNAFPDGWDDFLDCLDALVPEMQFIDGNRIDGLELTLTHGDTCERLNLTRADETLTLDKNSSTHSYRLGTNGTKKFLAVCQKFFDALEVTDDNLCEMKLAVKLTHHDESTTEITATYSEFAMPGVVKFAEAIHEFMPDLTAKIFVPENIRLIDAEKIILCKVQFKGSYKSYTYRTEDETLAVGDVVDVPVGRNNDIVQARIVDIGYFDADDTPFPPDKIKTVAGKHAGNGWENY